MNDLEKKRPNWFLLGMIAAMSTSLTAFSWNYEDTRTISYSPIDEEYLIIEPDYDRIFIERNDPINTEPQRSKNKAVASSERLSINLTKIDNRKSTVQMIGTKKSSHTLDRSLKSSSTSAVKSYRNIALHEMPYLRKCGNLKDATERFQCTQSQMRNHIAENFNVPSKDEVTNFPERFLISFIVDEYGRIQEIRPIDVIDSKLLEEVQKAFESMPEMVPAASAGRRTAVRFEIPIAIQRIGS